MAATIRSPGPEGTKTPIARRSVGPAEPREFARALQVAEKNHGLYPTHGKVVREGIRLAHESLLACFASSPGPLRIEVSRHDLRVQGEVVLKDENETRGLSRRLHKESLREISFEEGIAEEEIASFLRCLAPRAGSDEEDEDGFTERFRSEDCPHLRVEAIEPTLDDEAEGSIPTARPLDSEACVDRFRLTPEEESEIAEALGQKVEEDLPTGLELEPAELERIQGLVREAERDFPVSDLVDLVFELTLSGRDSSNLGEWLKILCDIVRAHALEFDFERAAAILSRLSRSLTDEASDSLRAQVRESCRGLSDRATLEAVAAFLKESGPLDENHGAFRFLGDLGPPAIPQICELLAVPAHAAALSRILIRRGTECGDAIARFLTHPNPVVVKSVMHALIASGQGSAVERIETVLRHEDEGLRVHAARTLLDSAEDRHWPVFLRLLDERAHLLVAVALQYFTRFPSPRAWDALAAFARGRPCRDLDPQEQEIAFRACLVTAPTKAVDFLASEVVGWGFAWSEASYRRKSAALCAAADSGLPSATAWLERLVRRRGTIGSLALEALQSRKRKLGSAPVEVRRA